MTDEYIQVICNCPNEQVANQIATELVEQRLAACVNILPKIKSVYRWQDKIETDIEIQLLIKTADALYSQLEQQIILHHPYEVPEIIAVPILKGSPGYLQWLKENIK